LYLGWLDRYERQEGENAPIGLILCSESGREEIELLKYGSRRDSGRGILDCIARKGRVRAKDTGTAFGNTREAGSAMFVAA